VLLMKEFHKDLTDTSAGTVTYCILTLGIGVYSRKLTIVICSRTSFGYPLQCTLADDPFLSLPLLLFSEPLSGVGLRRVLKA
jgi:hypothetical protein